jgi:tetratricopeptide (TPR) repeat protein
LGIAASFGRQAYADRFTYVPMIGFSILMVWAYAKLKKGILGRRIVLTLMSVGLVGVVVLYAVISKEYTATFRDELTASKRVLSVDDLNADALRVIGGAILMEKDDPSEAIHYFRQAIAVDPYHQAGLDLIFALRKRGRPEDLIEYENLTKQIRENPYADGHGLVLSMLAEDAVKKGDIKEARKFFTAMAEASNPVFSEKARQWLRTNP